MRVRLLRKLAERLDGVDVSACAVGDLVEVTRREAEVLVAEGWAESLTRGLRLVQFPRPAVERLRQIRREMEEGCYASNSAVEPKT
jgi:hypothetical protein